jgi:GT2 family glycosyltransferase
VQGFASGSAFPVKHLWLAHDGFQAGRMRNRAIAAAACEYLVLIDGDMLLHPEFLADHRRAAARGFYQQGCRVLLNPRATARALTAGELPRFSAAGLGVRRRLYALHAPAFVRPLARAANALLAVKACNQGFWRDDLTRVNGFDEDLSGWGAEDKELCARLDNAGVRRRSILFGAIAFHLHHPAADRSANERNLAALARTCATGRTRCDHGIVTATGGSR